MAARGALVALAVVIACGGGLRLAAAATAGHHLSADERAYGRLAIDIATTGHYGDPKISTPTRWAPGAPVVFGLAARLFGRGHAHQALEVPVARRVEFVLGTLTLAAAFALTALLAGPWPGVASAAVLALYPPLIGIDHFQLTEPLAGLLLLGGVLALTLGRGVRPAAAAGVLLGLAVLTRADLLLAPAVAALALWWAERGWRRPAGLAVAALVIVLPWVAFVSIHRGEAVPVSEGGPSNLFIGTYLPGHGTIFGLKHSLAAETRRHDPALRGVPAFKLPARAVLTAVAARDPKLTPDQALTHEAMRNLCRYALGQPLRFAGMMAAKVGRMWGRAFRSPQPVLVAWHLVLLAFALAGVIVELRRRVPAAAVVAAIALWSTFDNALLVAEPRHNMPLIPMLTAVGIAGCSRRAAVARRQPFRSRSGAAL